MTLLDINHCSNINQLQKLQLKLQNGGYNMAKDSLWDQLSKAAERRLTFLRNQKNEKDRDKRKEER